MTNPVSDRLESTSLVCQPSQIRFIVEQNVWEKQETRDWRQVYEFRALPLCSWNLKLSIYNSFVGDSAKWFLAVF